MAFDLKSETGEKFEFSNSGWRYLIEFAEAHGFRWPADRNGEDKDTLTSTEAAALAACIERGIGGESSSEAAKRVSLELTQLLVTRSNSPLFRSDHIVLEAKTIDYWRQFVRFARVGGFSMTF